MATENSEDSPLTFVYSGNTETLTNIRLPSGVVLWFDPDPYVPTKWDPKPDITAYELALLIPYLHGGIRKSDMDKLGTASRHLEIAD